MNTSNIYQKHLDLTKRNFIEQGLNNNETFKGIANTISKSPMTVSNEIKRNKIFVKGNSFNRSRTYDNNCPKLRKVPYVCNGCESRKGCRKNKYYYFAKDADSLYRERLVNSRIGINLTAEEFNRLNEIVSNDIRKGHSFAMILHNHKGEFSVKERTLYNYVEKGYLDIINLDLPRKVRYKKRKKETETIPRNSKHRINRTYQDFLKYKELYFIENGIDFDTVQMDTVEGKKGESVLLTLLFTQSNFLLAFKMEEKTMACVTNIFEELKITLGLEEFYEIFPVILTDNGSEFFAPELIEDNGPWVPKTKVFYCDPRQSQQKAKIEVTHEYIRRFIPKGTSFDDYSQEQITLMINHINSTPRKIFEWSTPFDILSIFVPIEFFEEFSLEKIHEWNVVLKPEILELKKDNTNK